MAIRNADVFRASALVLAFGLVAHAQQPPLQQASRSQGRYATGGWTASSPSRSSPSRTVPQSRAVSQSAPQQNYRARFLPQDGLQGLPTLPDGAAGGAEPAPPALPGEFPRGSLSDRDSELSQPSTLGLPAPTQGIPSGPTSSSAAGLGIDPPAQLLPATDPSSLAPAAEVLPARDPANGQQFGAPSMPASQSFDPPATSMPAMSDFSYPGATDSPSRPVGRMAQPASHSEQGSSQLRVKQERSGAVLPQRQITPNPADSRPRLSAEVIATGQPFVSPGRQRGNYATRPINPAFYQMAAYQRSAPVSNVAIGTYPPNTYSRNSQGQVAAPSTNLAQRQNAPARFTSNATPMPATTVEATQQQARQNPGFYQTAFTQQCNEPGFPSTGINGAYVPPTITPGGAPGLYAQGNAGYRPLFTLGQENYNVALGRGMVGQPTVYVAGQPVRNFLRYVFP